MGDLAGIKKKITDMAQTVLNMWQETFRAFMEHNIDLIAEILKEEEKLNRWEEEITADIVTYSRGLSDKKEELKALIYVEVVEDLELIGDYCKDILERVQIKIEEKLLFTEDAVKEYDELYHKTENALNEIVGAFKNDDIESIKVVLKKQEHIDALVDQYRARHNQRMINGVCSPMACNMFLNMLDFTAAVYYHAKKIARNLLKIK
ncbi:MAG: PhoU domain-containing protein [Candidatus Omnitrophota bacterium]